MNRISSQTTWFSKYVFPVIWFSFVGFFLLTILFTNKSQGGPPFLVMIGPILMGVFGYFMMKKMVWDLADEVFDDGDSLLVRVGSEQQRIPLASIINVSYAYMMNPARVTLTLRGSGQFGHEISFAARTSWVPFVRRPEIVDLIRRVDEARQAAK